MMLKMGDKVQSDRGLEAEIVQMNDDGHSAMVKLAGDGHKNAIVSLQLERLKWIAAYTMKPGLPPP